jgi:hypothetical protein
MEPMGILLFDQFPEIGDDVIVMDFDPGDVFIRVVISIRQNKAR